MNHPLRRAAAPLALAALLAALPAAAPAQQVARIPFADRVLSGAPTPVFSVGAEEGQSWEMLNQAQQAAFDAQDNLYVLDRGNHRVLVFGPGGRFVRQVGKRGDGPGELQVPVGIAVLRDGTLVVMDLAHRNFALFGRDGAYLRSIPLDEEAGMPSLGSLAAHPSGALVSLFRPRPTTRDGAIRAGTFNAGNMSLTRVPLSGGALAKLFEMPDGATVTQSGSATERTTMISGPPAFAAPKLWGVLPDGGFVVAHTPGYTLKVLDAQGRMTRAIQRARHTRLATEADREHAREQRREMLASGRGRISVVRGGPPGGGGGGGGGRGPMSAAQIEAQLRDMRFADTIPALQGLVVAPSGRIWVARTGERWGDPGPIDIVTAAGQYVGTVRGQKLPAAISATGRAAYLERDENDVERVVVVQLPAGWR